MREGENLLHLRHCPVGKLGRPRVADGGGDDSSTDVKNGAAFLPHLSSISRALGDVSRDDAKMKGMDQVEVIPLR